MGKSAESECCIAGCFGLFSSFQPFIFKINWIICYFSKRHSIV